ncbi:DNA (cytosine-5-)-methyltransferase [Zunongwangia sp. SCSIO 43204]|uniref:DNA cytosine methyltransferase n=1 Tax=Zunongwangia sp. SCSIO 43204 TaxID=2779359 RepID=UPI001CA8F658|nr:DNA (cytosine-5-)-methyltransferase [Zunongwangia sp. SCSIO 43204]UAB83173.1 DNA (cytosine-5-)-methyltransferase [Zunongwangia sp. SCSIO 43204]
MNYKENTDTVLPAEDYQSKINYSSKKNICSGNFKVLSLFSGCGGMDLGLRGDFIFRDKYYPKNPFSTILANDIDPAATFTYESNEKYFGDHQIIQADIREVPHKIIPDFDFMIAGFPCQPFSNAGLRKGINDERGNLFEECEKILKEKEQSEKKPIGFIFENVRGIMSSKMPDGTTIPEEIVKRTKKLGYNTVYKLVKASNYGVPSARYRVIIVGLKDEYQKFDFDLLDKVVEEFDIPNENNNKYDLMLGSILSDIKKDTPQSKDFWKYSPSGQYMVDKIGPCYGNKKTLNLFKSKTPIEELPEKIHKGRSWKNMNREDMSERFRKIHDNPKKYRSPNFYRRFSLTEINGTITASAQPEACGITHPLENRRYTIREIARIQSFPDDFIFPYRTIANAYKVIGNAVPPILGWVISRAISKHLKENE